MLRWIDGFESYGVTNGNTAIGALNKYTNALGTITVRAGRLAGHSISLNSSAVLTTPAFTASDTFTVGFAYYYEKMSNIEEPVFQLIDGSTVQCSLYLDPNGELRIYRSLAGTSLGFTTGARIRSGVWNYIEIKIKVSTTVGTVDIHINGISVLSLSSVNTDQHTSSQATAVALCGATSTNTSTFDDFYVLDKSGSNNTTFLGPQKVTTVFPTSDAGTNQWGSIGAGFTHAAQVNENPNDGNLSYLVDSTSGHTEELNYVATGSEVTTIKGIQMNTIFDTDSGAAFSVKNHVNSGGTSSDDAGTAGTNGTYVTAARLVETDPHTSALWTKTNLDASLFGVKTA